MHALVRRKYVQKIKKLADWSREEASGVLFHIYTLMHPVECAISSEHHCNLHSRLYKLSDCLIVHSYSVTFGLPVPCQPCAFINELSEVLCFPIKHSKIPCFNCELNLKSVGLQCTTCLGSNWNCSNWLCFIVEI